ncbi:MoaD/ThiS family protein [Marinomonas sp. A79]|uniref:MoaD/ThiS family protein n=1 Tax=Marinomonas vulgaris TaxID=2823372 RepID=A0ABS5HA74_9GAMM|nr:MoaD/ThiS family protein [Marinomonas vulgaris]MBR7888576.1 MoaD/ThiS family protein [Marinomonas vulgaris]
MNSISVVFFSSLRESLGLGEYSFTLNAPMTIGELKKQLAERLDNGQALLASGIQSSVDFDFARDNDVISDTAREVAFFPPVTGG